jgi:hypothetical protein
MRSIFGAARIAASAALVSSSYREMGAAAWGVRYCPHAADYEVGWPDVAAVGLSMGGDVSSHAIATKQENPDSSPGFKKQSSKGARDD